MRIFKESVPSSRIEALMKVASKVKRNVPEFNISVGESYDKCFIHLDKIEGRLHRRAEWHNVCDVEVTMPDDSGWRLLATFEDGNMFITDPYHKIEFKNPAHGAEYTKCDLCGHRCYNSYLISNTETGEEMQVGCEYVKRFGLTQTSWMHKFYAELYRGYNFRITTIEDEECDLWSWGTDKDAFRAITVAELIKACREYYSMNPK